MPTRPLRKDLLLDLATQEGIRIYPAEADDRTTPLEDSNLVRKLTADVRHQLGPDTRFASSWEGLAGFWVSFRIQADDPEDTLASSGSCCPAERIMRPHALEWMWWGAAALSLAMLGAYMIVSRLNRPLKAWLCRRAHGGTWRSPTPPQRERAGRNGGPGPRLQPDVP
jgi:two-component system osmolarity sensor histidine kinase EnvZ